MSVYTATAQANPNIAFIKYWGNQDHTLRIPENGSISMNLDGLHTTTTVTFASDYRNDQLILNNNPVEGSVFKRVSAFLDRVRKLAGIEQFAAVNSQNNFPTGAGIASSASAFAALSLAATSAAGLHLDEKALSRLARTGSGSACRSIPSGFVEWQAGDSDLTSYAHSIAPPEYWNLVDCIAVVAVGHKSTGSSEGHTTASTSPLQAARVSDAERRLRLCRQAILNRDFETFAQITELDSNLMHSVMMTSTPSLFYWTPPTLDVIHSVQTWRKQGLPVCYTIDAGPNIHVITLSDSVEQVSRRLSDIPGVLEILIARPGGACKLLN
jgi:diphosphomevalonate decarboxylase